MDALFAGVVHNFRARVPNFSLQGVCLPRPRPLDKRPYLRAFGVAPGYTAGIAELHIARNLLDVPLHGADATLVEILKNHAEDLLQRVPSVDSLLYDVQRALSQGLERGQVSLALIAPPLGMSSRTLSRRLAELGTSFRGELDTMRRDLALRLVQDGHEPLGAIAERLGFDTPSGFLRAFRRWTGAAPSAFRAKGRSQREASI